MTRERSRGVTEWIRAAAQPAASLRTERHCEGRDPQGGSGIRGEAAGGPGSDTVVDPFYYQLLCRGILHGGSEGVPGYLSDGSGHKLQAVFHNDQYEETCKEMG